MHFWENYAVFDRLALRNASRLMRTGSSGLRGKDRPSFWKSKSDREGTIRICL